MPQGSAAPGGGSGAGGDAGASGGTSLPRRERCGPATAQPRLIAYNQGAPRQLATDGTHLFWFQNLVGWDGLMRWTRGGGPPISLVPGASAYGVVLDETHLYWVKYDNAGALYRIPKDGGTPFAVASGLLRAVALTADEDTLYWLESGTLGASYSDGRVAKHDKETGSTTVLATERDGLRSIAVTALQVYWTEADPKVPIDGRGTLVRVPKSGGVPRAVFERQAMSALISDGETIYFTAASNDGAYPNAIFKLSPEMTEPQLVFEGGEFIFELQMDQDCFYFQDGSTAIKRLWKMGGKAYTIADLQNEHGASVAVDATVVYFTEPDGQRVWEVDK